MWPFKKKQGLPPAPTTSKKRTKKISSKPVEVDVGVTRVRVDFDDGRTFIHKIYGEIYQSVQCGQDANLCYGYPVIEPSVGQIAITTSLDVARYRIANYQGLLVLTFVDDPRLVRETVIGTPIKFEILDTNPYLDKVTEYFVEEIK